MRGEQVVMDEDVGEAFAGEGKSDASEEAELADDFQSDFEWKCAEM